MEISLLFVASIKRLAKTIFWGGVGSNDCGKTPSINIILQLETPDKGQVYYFKDGKSCQTEHRLFTIRQEYG